MAAFLDKTASLTPLAKEVIENKATERPDPHAHRQFTGKGTYLCRRCGLALFPGTHQFDAGCGWPSFDKECLEHIRYYPDKDGIRTEICCKRCDAHLGHVFKGEQFTSLNTRFCVNAVSIDFVPQAQVKDSEEIIVAGGCFWHIDYVLGQLQGVLKTESGYTGGHLEQPDYHSVCRGDSGHYEAVRVLYDPALITLKQVLQVFFNSHDPAQTNGQGADIGQQYQSAVFYYNKSQQNIISEVIETIKNQGHSVASKILPISTFWPAEAYHQDYLLKRETRP